MPHESSWPAARLDHDLYNQLLGVVLQKACRQQLAWICTIL